MAKRQVEIETIIGKREHKTMRILPSLASLIDEVAKKEGRSFSNTTEKLLYEAFEHRGVLKANK